MPGRSHRLSARGGLAVEVHAGVEPEVLAWLEERLAREPTPPSAERGLVLGSILCTFRAERDVLVLEAPVLDAAPRAGEPDPRTDDATIAARLGYEQARIAEGYGVDVARPGVIHAMTCLAWRGWDAPGWFGARREESVGSDSGWRVWDGARPEGEPREVSVAEVIVRRPALARFLAFPRGASIRYTLGLLQVSMDDRALEVAPGSWLAERASRPPIQLDPAWRAEVIRGWRAEGATSAHVPSGLVDRVAERQLVSNETAKALAVAAQRELARDLAYDLAFVRKLRAWLRQGREDVAVQQLAALTHQTPEAARRFLARHRASVDAGKVPPRGDDDFE